MFEGSTVIENVVGPSKVGGRGGYVLGQGGAEEIRGLKACYEYFTQTWADNWFF